MARSMPENAVNSRPSFWQLRLAGTQRIGTMPVTANDAA